MIIQHNIMALNSYNRLGTNNNAVQKNLEKLSSGYRINRAGDDAAGLAISEKMRAQITGLERAQLNAKDGISLVQTAEGALTEVHSMLNRLVELGVESANGIYQATDRDKIQAEVDQITEEIDRISAGTNFNGLKLLDGSLREDAPAAETKPVTADISALAGTPLGAVETVDATATSSSATLKAITPVAEGDTIKYTVEYFDKDGTKQSKDIEFEVTGDPTQAGDATLTRIYRDADGNIIKDDDGNTKYGTEYDTQNTVSSGNSTIDLVSLGTALQKELNEELKTDETLKAAFEKIEDSATPDGKITFTAADTGANGASLFAIHSTFTPKAGGASTYDVATPGTTTAGENEFGVIDLSKATLWDGSKDTLEDAIFEINGKKFVFYAIPDDPANPTAYLDLTEEQKTWLNDIGVENNHVQATDNTGAAAGTLDFTNYQEMAEKINEETGLKTEAGEIDANGAWDNTQGTQLALKDGAAAPTPVETTGTRGLTLQVGDTNEDFNKVTVYIDDMSSKGLGIDDLDVTDQGISGESIDRVKAAIEKVSVNRGRLGALQNRLEHTLNNLATTTENMTNAESRIRDTDMAQEMMAFTKNNVLVQAAQSMLAQANQQPQQVLQLLR